MLLIWDDENAEHIARHGVKREEADFVVKRAEPPYPREIEDEKHVIWGQTLEGRYLQVIFVYLQEEEVDWDKLDPMDKIRYADGEEEIGRVIHSRELTDAEKRRLRRSTRN